MAKQPRNLASMAISTTSTLPSCIASKKPTKSHNAPSGNTSSCNVVKTVSNSASLRHARSPGSVCLCSVGECCTLCAVPANANLDCFSRAEVEAMLRRQESSIRSEMNSHLLSLEDQITNLTHRVYTLENSSHSSSQVSSHTSTTSRTGSQYIHRHPQWDIRRRSSLQINPNPSNTLPFRIVWGTQRSCTSQVVWKAITALLPTRVHSSILVKRSSRHKEAKLIWWFTIMAPSEASGGDFI